MDRVQGRAGARDTTPAPPDNQVPEEPISEPNPPYCLPTIRGEIFAFARMVEARRMALEQEEALHPQTVPYSPAQLLSRLNSCRARLVDLVAADEWDPYAIRDAAASVAMYAERITRRVEP